MAYLMRYFATGRVDNISDLSLQIAGNLSGGGRIVKNGGQHFKASHVGVDLMVKHAQQRII